MPINEIFLYIAAAGILVFLELLPLFRSNEKKTAVIYCVISAVALLYLTATDVFPLSEGINSYLTHFIKNLSGG